MPNQSQPSTAGGPPASASRLTAERVAGWNATAAWVLGFAALALLGVLAVEGPMAGKLGPEAPALVQRLAPVKPMFLGPVDAPMQPAEAAQWRAWAGPGGETRVRVLHTLHDPEVPKLGGMARGRLAAKGLDGESVSRIAGWGKRIAGAGPPQSHAIEKAFTQAVSGSAGLALAGGAKSWPSEVLIELAGMASERPELGSELTGRLAAATTVYGVLESEAVAVETPEGLMVVCRFALPDDGGKPPLGLVMHQDGDRRALLLCLEGTTIPVAGINDQGIAAMRISPEDTGDNYEPGIGPDAVALLREVLMRGTDPGLDRIDPVPGRMDEMAVGAYLRGLSVPSETVLTRHASPGIWMVADSKSAYRYEWKAVGSGQQADGGFEFGALRSGGVLHAWAGYSAPEHKGKGKSWSGIGSPKLAEEVVRMGVGAFSLGKVEKLLASGSEFRIALWPSRKAILFHANGQLVAIETGSSMRN